MVSTRCIQNIPQPHVLGLARINSRSARAHSGNGLRRLAHAGKEIRLVSHPQLASDRGRCALAEATGRLHLAARYSEDSAFAQMGDDAQVIDDALNNLEEIVRIVTMR